jgi:hypothetical protein
MRTKNLQMWVGGWGRHLLRQLAAHPARGPRHVLFATCDHYEPRWAGASPRIAAERVDVWRRTYPEVARRFRDADGHPPRHSFFFPGEEYDPAYLDALAALARGGLGELELHVHHDGDNAANLRQGIGEYLQLYTQHGHLSRDAEGRARYGFIHGNWALANGRRDGRFCGVDAELPLLWDTGCYADFTFPAAPDESQPNHVNEIYWPTGDLSRRRAYEQGEPARVGTIMRDRILIITGPLTLALRNSRVPVYIESGDITGHSPATAARVARWVAQNIHVAGRPEWVFVKTHTHGAQERNWPALLGGGAVALHEVLTTRYNDRRQWVLHYVTAREMYNIAIAAMDGKSGDPNDYRDYVLQPPPLLR